MSLKEMCVGGLLALLTGVAAPGPVHAEVVARRIAPPRAAKRLKRDPLPQRMRFEDDIVEGMAATGGGTLINGRRPAKQSHLLITRANFLPELLKSAEDL